jgi:hypothetical protein
MSVKLRGHGNACQKLQHSRRTLPEDCELVCECPGRPHVLGAPDAWAPGPREKYTRVRERGARRVWRATGLTPCTYHGCTAPQAAAQMEPVDMRKMSSASAVRNTVVKDTVASSCTSTGGASSARVASFMSAFVGAPFICRAAADSSVPRQRQTRTPARLRSAQHTAHVTGSARCVYCAVPMHLGFLEGF